MERWPLVEVPCTIFQLISDSEYFGFEIRLSNFPTYRFQVNRSLINKREYQYCITYLTKKILKIAFLRSANY